MLSRIVTLSASGTLKRIFLLLSVPLEMLSFAYVAPAFTDKSTLPSPTIFTIQCEPAGTLKSKLNVSGYAARIALYSSTVIVKTFKSGSLPLNEIWPQYLFATISPLASKFAKEFEVAVSWLKASSKSIDSSDVPLRKLPLTSPPTTTFPAV